MTHRHAFTYTGTYANCVCGMTFSMWLDLYNKGYTNES